jgi:hypothetical protein
MAKHALAPCPAPNCDKLGSFAHGFCRHCWVIWKTACIENGSWQRTSNHTALVPQAEPLPSWTYEGREDELAEQCGQEEVKG